MRSDDVMDMIRLSDDEVVAVAVDARTFWPGALPTVPDDAARLAEASFRGHRSLLCRDLLGPDGRVTEPVAALAGGLAGRSDRVDVFLGSARFERASWGLATSCYPGASGWTVETVTVLGVHTVSRQPEEELRSFWQTLLGAAISDGPPREDLVLDDSSPVWICVASGDPQGPLVAARKGELCLVRRGGADLLVEPLGVDELTMVVQLLHDAVVSALPAVRAGSSRGSDVEQSLSG